MLNTICKWCINFIKGKDENDYNDGTPLRDDSKNTDKCNETDYKVTENTFCINDKFKEK